MTKTKRSRHGRGVGPRKLRPTGRPRYRFAARQSQQVHRRCENVAIWFEHLGEYYDDVLVSLKKYDKRAVAAIRAFSPWAQWDATAKVWRIHPGYAERLAADLQSLGYTVGGGWRSMALAARCGPRKAAEGNEAHYETTCAGCRKQIRKGKPAHWVDGLMLHVHCHRPDPRFGIESRKPGEERPCCDCFLIHKGKCW